MTDTAERYVPRSEIEAALRHKVASARWARDQGSAATYARIHAQIDADLTDWETSDDCD